MPNIPSGLVPTAAWCQPAGPSPDHRPHRVVVLALDGVVPFELAIPARILGSPRDASGRPLYEVLTCGLRPGPVTTGADFAIQVEHGAELLATADDDPLVVVWRFGRGRSMAFTTDCGPHWAPPPFVEWPGYQRFWSNAVSWLTARG